MGIRMDLIIPPIIVGLLIIMIFRVNSFVMETSVDNQLNNDMQMFADVTSKVIMEEVKTAGNIIEPTDPDTSSSVLRFIVENIGDTVKVEMKGKNLAIIRKSAISPSIPDTVIYPSSLSYMQFDLVRKPMGEPIPYYLNIQLETESNAGQHVSLNTKDIQTVKGFSENEVYLRNIHRKSL